MMILFTGTQLRRIQAKLRELNSEAEKLIDGFVISSTDSVILQGLSDLEDTAKDIIRICKIEQGKR